MKILGKYKPWKYLLWLGLFLIAAGLTIGFLSEEWGILPLAFIIIGIVSTGFWLVRQSQQTKWWERRSTQAGTNAIVATVAVLVIIGLINFLGTRYNIKTDLTETKLFTLAPQSQELVNSLKEPVKVWVFDVNQNSQDRELLENYRSWNSKFKFEYVDPRSKPGLAEKFGVKSFGEVYLEYRDRRELVQVVNNLNNERLSEIQLTNRLQQITSNTTVTVYFLQGHGEHSLSRGKNAVSQAVKALADKNYIAKPLNLTEQSRVPADAAVVVVAGSERALLDSEVKALQDYLNAGGNLLLAIDPGIESKLESLLAQWGIKLDTRLAVDITAKNTLGSAVPIVTEYGQHPITKDFDNGISFYPLARPLEIESVKGVESSALLLTKAFPNSWAESDLESENLEFNEEDGDSRGPLTLGVALTRKIPEKPAPKPQPTSTTSPTPKTEASSKTETKSSPTPTASPTPKTEASPKTESKSSPTPTASPTPKTEASPKTESKSSPTPTASPTPKSENKKEETAKESRLVVFGNSTFATDGLFEQQLNGDVFLNSVTWLSQQDTQPLSIRPKETKNRRLNLSQAQANVLAWSSLLVLPLLGLLSAAFLWWQRR
ncbi:MAG: Gldg family protein [Nostocaceae cyanobacterium]|nr:Gldg family protein [Nostocaceae cyanobacterium]